MPLSAGTRLGPYEVIAAIGAGGMGEVYRARDTRLNRDVALKTLPQLFAQDAERVARFTREAQTLAALNHSNIAQIYGIEGLPPTGGQPAALIMELVEGDELSQIIARGPVPMAEALAIARQIADALEAAHEQGIVHRDLKPANVKVRADGTVKVLDFGLAKALGSGSTRGASNDASPSNSPTLTAHGTEMGMILGTAAYMAPEQARGRPIDRRADIWAFGVVLFEMLSGRRVFEGDDISDVLAAVLRQDIDWNALPATTPASVRRLLKRCLERDPRKRLSAIADARLEIEEPEPAVAPAVTIDARTRSSSSWAARLAPALAGVALTALAAYAIWPSASGTAAPASGPLVRSSILPPAGQSLYPDSTGVAISPDGTKIALIIGSANQSEATELWVRSLDTMVAKRLDLGATLPFWSPDGRRIGYSASGGNKLKTIAVTGGRPDVVSDSETTRGAVWTPSNVILFSHAAGPLLQVPATGGAATPITMLDETRKERNHRFPSLLPDGDHFLYVALPSRDGKFDVFAGSLSDQTHKARVFVGALDSAPVYADGYLLYSRQGVLAAVPFDAKSLKLTGDPILLDDEPGHLMDPARSYTAARSASVSTTGALAYYSAASTNTIGVWYDATGAQTGTLNLPPGYYDAATISPDGTRAIAVRSASAAASSLWVVDLARGMAMPFSTGPGRNDSPLWSPDGTRVVFASDRSGLQQFFTKNANEPGPETEFYTSDEMFKAPYGFSPDGSSIVMNALDSKTAQDVLVLDASGKSPPKTVVSSAVRDLGGYVSPDGKWLAYASEGAGSLELYIQPFPGPGRAVQVSEEGGLLAWWTRDSRQIVWASSDFRSIWRADVMPGSTLAIKNQRKIATLPPGILWIDAMPDRQRFLAIEPERTGIGSVTIVQNWARALEGKR